MAVRDRQIEEWAHRVRTEYLEMPGMKLTRSQVRRLWLLDPPLCDAVLDVLVESGFLRRRRDDTYSRVSSLA
jgi:hypothetical protein